MKLLLVVLVLSFGASDALKWWRCDNGGSVVNTVMVSGCEETDRCTLKKRTTHTVNLSFIPDADTTATYVKVYGRVWGLDIPFPLQNSNGCVNSGLVCPLEKGKVYHYHNSIPIESYFPSINFAIKWKMLDANEDEMYCIQADAQISA